MDSENKTLEGVDTEQGLEPALDSAEKERLQQAVEELAEQRAASPQEVAAQTHMQLYKTLVQDLEKVSGGAAKRIIRYMAGYPFFVDELNPQDKQVEALAHVVDRCVQAKFTVIMCEALAQEARNAAQVKELNDSIPPVPADLPKSEELLALEAEQNNNESQEGDK